MKSPLLALGALLYSIARPVVAQDQDRRFYVGLDLGQGRINRQYSEYSRGPGGEFRSTAWKLRFGWKLSPHWAFEAGYTHFGDYGGTQPVLVMPGPADEPTVVAQGDLDTATRGFDVSAISTWPVGE